MATNNEHSTLRRRMAKVVGRSIPDAAWAMVVDDGYVAEALDPAFDGAGEEELASRLTRLLRIGDDLLRSARHQDRSTPRTTVLDSDYLRSRIEAVSRLAAEQAAGDVEILEFRKRVLSRDAPMSADEAEAYLDLPAARRSGHMGPDRDAPLEVLRYQNAHMSLDLHVWPGSPLDSLRKLAQELARSYPWEPDQAAAFVLEGLIPLATPFLLRLPQTWHEGRPRRARLVMEVELWMPASAVLRAYRDAQRQVLPGHNRPVSRRSINLVNFVMTHRPASWPELRAQWNSEHPAAAYADYRLLRTAFLRAQQSVGHPHHRLYTGTDGTDQPRNDGVSSRS